MGVRGPDQLRGEVATMPTADELMLLLTSSALVVVAIVGRRSENPVFVIGSIAGGLLCLVAVCFSAPSLLAVALAVWLPVMIYDYRRERRALRRPGRHAADERWPRDDT
jgi:hypothetical protein